MELVKRYFPEFENHQIEQLNTFSILLKEWNQKINLISRKNEDKIEEQHILHSLSIAKLIEFKPGTSVLDLGTGGGLPGIPLSIVYPDTQFHLVDSIQKKIKVVDDICATMKLNNVSAQQERVENLTMKFDFVVTRAVASSDKIMQWTKKLFKQENNHDFVNGIFALKGGDLTEELESVKSDYDIIPLSEFYDEEFYETKKIVYLPMGFLS